VRSKYDVIRRAVYLFLVFLKILLTNTNMKKSCNNIKAYPGEYLYQFRIVRLIGDLKFAGCGLAQPKHFVSSPKFPYIISCASRMMFAHYTS